MKKAIIVVIQKNENKHKRHTSEKVKQNINKSTFFVNKCPDET